MDSQLFSRTYVLRNDDQAFFREVSGLLDTLPHPSLDLELCVKEALANAMRHSGGSEVSVTVCRRRGLSQYRCTVQDDGEGFDVSAILERGFPTDALQDHGRGIPLIHAYAEKVRFLNHGRAIVFDVKDPVRAGA